MGDLGAHVAYSPLSQTRHFFDVFTRKTLLSPGLSCPEFQAHARRVTFEAAKDEIVFPCPFQQCEAVSVLKAIEACWAACIADLRFGEQPRRINIQLERSARYLLGSYLFTIDGLSKGDPEVKTRLKDTDLKKAQSILYRRFSSNLYATKIPGDFFHLHGSLDASTALRMIGLEPFRPDVTEYRQCIEVIEAQMKTFTLDQLEEINARHKQAGVTAYRREDFEKTDYGKTIIAEPKWTVSLTGNKTPAAAFPKADGLKLLSGIKVLELCRVIAGPSVCRILAEYGASVLKVTSPDLSDVPFFQVEGNMGKHTADLDLKSPEGRAFFEQLLGAADVVVDGYRTGAIQRLGYGPEELDKIASARGRGFVYVSENCFGYGKHVDRPGWQQIADSVSGVAWAQGRFMNLDEPCIPPFPMSDYGTGIMGAIAALEAIFLRARDGGSYHAKCCLVQYDNLLFQMGQYPDEVQARLRQDFAGPFFDLRHADSTDEFSARALMTMKSRVSHIFDDEDGWAQTWFSPGFKGVEVKCVKPQSNVQGIEVGYDRPTRPNGTDVASWDDWEVEQPIR